MKKFAIINDDDIVIKTVETSVMITAPGAIECDNSPVDIGWYWTGTKFEPPAPPDPRTMARLSRMNFMLRLDDCGYLDAVEQDVADGKLSKRAKIMWDNAEEFDRLSPELDKWAADLGFTEEQLDEVFEIKST